MSDKPLLCLFEGAFGHQVAAQLQASDRDLSAVELSSDSWRSTLADVRGVLLARARRLDDQADEIDALCAHHAIPWTNATLHDRWLLVGPLVVPGRGACHRCFRRRQQTHARMPERDRAIEGALRSAGAAGLRGFTPAAVTMAAALARADLAADATAAGLLRTIDLLTLDVGTSEVVRIHGCERCGSRPDAQRFTRHLIPVLTELLP